MPEAKTSPVGPYEITREIVRGGMGVMYLARDERLDREVAIKARPEELASDPDRPARFEREAKTLAALNHPSIASIYGLQDAEASALSSSNRCPVKRWIRFSRAAPCR